MINSAFWMLNIMVKFIRCRGIAEYSIKTGNREPVVLW